MMVGSFLGKDGLTRHRFLVFRRVELELILEQSSLRLERVEADLIDACRTGGLLLSIQGREEIVDAAGRDVNVVLERPRQLLARRTELGVHVDQLRVQFLHVRVTGQQRAGLERDFGLQGAALLRYAADELVVGDIGDLADAVLPDHLLDQLGFGLRVGLRRAGLGQLGIHVAELLSRDGGIVGPHQQA